MDTEKIYGGGFTKAMLQIEEGCMQQREHSPGQPCVPNDECYCWQAGLNQILSVSIFTDADEIRLMEIINEIDSLPAHLRRRLLESFGLKFE